MSNFIKRYSRVVGYFLGLVLLLMPHLSLAAGQCSKSGYTVLTINGILTDESGAKNNAFALCHKLGKSYKGEKITVDYLLNPSHIAGAADVADVLAQGIFHTVSDYDLTEMLSDASRRLTTEKVLLVGHSQGNFYANNFYKSVADKEGGIPKDSLRVYAVASPSNNVAGVFIPSQQDYITSDTDTVISTVAPILLSVLPANTHIDLAPGDDSMGHNFSGVYLKYQGARIVADMESSLDKLKANAAQSEDAPCMTPPKLTIAHELEGGILALADPLASITKTAFVNTAIALGDSVVKGVTAVASSVSSLTRSLAEALGDLGNKNGAAVLSAGTQLADNTEISLPSEPSREPLPENPSAQKISAPLPPFIALPENARLSPVATVNNSPDETNINSTNSSASHHSHSDGQASNTDAVTDTGGDITITPDPEIPLAPDPTPDPVSDPIPDPVPPNPTLVVIPPTTDPSDDANLSPSDLNKNSIPDRDEAEVTVDSDMSLPAGEYRFNTLAITNNATLTLEGDPLSPNLFKGVKILAANIRVDSGSHLSADNEGYSPTDPGPGASPVQTIGASYGGNSFTNPDNKTYGSATEPVNFGSSGGINFKYGYGGGAMRVIVSGTLTNNGSVNADGGEASSGGSIYVTTNILAGSGIFQANGGILSTFLGYSKSPGGGGRVAVYYNVSSFTGTAEAKGGCGNYNGFSPSCGEDGTAGLFNESSHDLFIGSSWKFLKDDEPFSFGKIFISNGAKVTGEEGVHITADEMHLDDNSSFMLADHQVLSVPTIIIDRGSTLTLSGQETINTNSISVKGNSTITVVPERVLSLAARNITVESGSYISAAGKGYVNGPGASSVNTTGASYGGIGIGSTPTSTYGSEMVPTDFGSGGAFSFRGGGALKLTVTGTLTDNGMIIADGDVTSSGGSIYITAKNIIGNGYVRAQGGGPYESGIFYAPGGGGRVALYYQVSTFTGRIEAPSEQIFFYAPGEGTVKIVNTSLPPPAPGPDPTPDPTHTPDPVPDPLPDPDTTAPAITGFTLNGNSGDITINPLTEQLTLALSASENVNWLSFRIENENDTTKFKTLQSGSTCVDGTSLCTKVWDGSLSSDGELSEGSYRIRVHMKDAADNEYQDYLPAHIIVNLSDSDSPPPA